MAIKKPSADLLSIMADLAKDSSPGNVQYLKDKDTTIKLLIPPGRELKQFYERFESTFQKKGAPVGTFERFPYYLICGVITEASEDGVADESRVRYVKVTKTIMADIVNLLQKGWDIFGANGSCITITKGKGSNGQVQYKTVAIPETFDASALTFPEESIEEAARGQEQSSAEYAAKEVTGEALV